LSPFEGRAFLVPVFDAGPLLARVLAELRDEKERVHISHALVLVVDDGCTDDTFADPSIVQEDTILIRHEKNLGKGAALLSGLRAAQERGIRSLVTLDADGQHPAHEAIRLFLQASPESALLLGVRDLKGAGAPRANQMSNRFSNMVLSLFGGHRLRDTQCGLRRYPVDQTLALGAHHPRYAFESDVVLRAARRGLAIEQLPTDVRYSEEASRVSHFDSVRDPAKIVLQVVLTTLTVQHFRSLRRWAEWAVFLSFFALLAFWLTR
jgi:glycosyltransferase involved in cell wall biosynthesis